MSTLRSVPSISPKVFQSQSSDVPPEVASTPRLCGLHARAVWSPALRTLAAGFAADLVSHTRRFWSTPPLANEVASVELQPSEETRILCPLKIWTGTSDEAARRSWT